MAFTRVLIAIVALGGSSTAGFAGPCALKLEQMQAEIDTRLEAKAAAGSYGVESVGARLHHEPTPASIAAAESRLHELSPALIAAVGKLMKRARRQDAAGQKAACEASLTEVQHALEP